MDEPQLRRESLKWLIRNFPKREYRIRPILFHDVGLTITQFLRVKYKGEELVSIPKYADLSIRPDLIALALINKNGLVTPLWIIGECKVSGLSASDLRQTAYNSGIAEAYESYLFYEGTLSQEVKALIESGSGLLYFGTNKWGKPVRKRLILVLYENGRFVRTVH